MRILALAVLGMPLVGAASAGVYDVRAFGATGDGRTKDTAAVQAAIDAAEKAGGGEVFLGAGTYLCGSIFLKDNIDFHLGPGAVVKASPDKADYNAPDVCPQNSPGDRAESVTGQHLFLAIEKRNVTVRGPGKVDGNSSVFLLNPKTGLPWGHTAETPKHEFWRGQGSIPFRPAQMLYFVECRDVRLTDLELADSHYWNVFLHGCERVLVRGLNIPNEKKHFHTHNGDGIDIDCSRFVTVSDCVIDTSDDCITLRASGARLKDQTNRDCAYITVANCVLSTPCNCLRAGVGNGCVHDVTLDNIVVHGARNALNFVGAWKACAKGVDFVNIRCSNWTVDCQKLIRLYPHKAEKVTFKNLYFSNFSGVAREPSELTGLAAMPAENIVFDNVDVACKVMVKNVKPLVVRASALEIVEAGASAGAR